MNLVEVRELLHPLADGELDPAAEESVRAALADFPECQHELAEIEATRALAREAFMAPVDAIDFAGFYGGVMARIEAEAPEAAISGVPVMREADAPGLWERIQAWLGELLRFERPLAAVASAAVVALLVGGIYVMQAGGTGDSAAIGGPAAGAVAATDDAATKKGERRGRETESMLADSNAASVEEIEVAIGRVEIDENTEDPERPMVVWHIVDEGAAPAAEKEL